MAVSARRSAVVIASSVAVLATVALTAAVTERGTTPATRAPRVTASPAAAPPRLGPGRAVADASVAGATSDVAVGDVRTLDGAVEAFTSYTTWLVTSPAAAARPRTAVDAVASRSLEPADAQMIRGMARDQEVAIEPAIGAYRVLASSGPAEALQLVMVEILAPFRYGTARRWLVVGGVVRWEAAGWRLAAIRPREVAQPTGQRDRAAAVLAARESLELPEIGWLSYRKPAS
jgi:hypothetical protein